MNNNKEIILCPFHTESTPSCVINYKNKTFHCFGCGEYGDIGVHGKLVSAIEENEIQDIAHMN